MQKAFQFSSSAFSLLLSQSGIISKKYQFFSKDGLELTVTIGGSDLTVFKLPLFPQGAPDAPSILPLCLKGSALELFLLKRLTSLFFFIWKFTSDQLVPYRAKAFSYAIHNLVCENDSPSLKQVPFCEMFCFPHPVWGSIWKCAHGKGYFICIINGSRPLQWLFERILLLCPQAIDKIIFLNSRFEGRQYWLSSHQVMTCRQLAGETSTDWL